MFYRRNTDGRLDFTVVVTTQVDSKEEEVMNSLTTVVTSGQSELLETAMVEMSSFVPISGAHNIFPPLIFLFLIHKCDLYFW